MHTVKRTVWLSVALAAFAWMGLAPGGVSARIALQPAQADPDPCAAPANAIVRENCRPGNPREEWDIADDGDPAIQGFATDMSVNVGARVEFKIDTHSDRYRIDVYRMGWYGGSGARRLDTLRPSVTLPQAQPPCRVHTQTSLVDCGTWAVSASWQVPADAVSGVYVARLVREDSEPEPWQTDGSWSRRAEPTRMPSPAPHRYGALGFGALRDKLKEKRASHIVFVVRDEASRAPILVQTSDPTWVAANRYGGSSLYGSWSESSPGGGGNLRDRASMVSYNRPLTNRRWSLPNQFFNSEYPLVRWLERNGYDVSYFAGVDSDRRGELIRQHRVFVSSGRDSYWSGPQRKNVEAARDAGVHLLFLSGNALYWRTRYEPSFDGTQTPHRTLVSYKETLAHGKLDPQRTDWTGAWRDGRVFNPKGAAPENALTGTFGAVGGLRHDRLMVPASYSARRFWRNTAVATLAPSEQAVLGNGVLGSVWDVEIDNGARPPGLIRLSETTVDGVPYLLDWGSVYDSGSATHHMTLYRAPSGALVFSAGTAQYAWGLDDTYTFWTNTARVRPHLMGVEPALQQATANLLADMGVQPATMQPGLRRGEPSTDATGPVSRVLSPADGSLVEGSVIIEGAAADVGGTVAAVEVSVDGGVTWRPTSGTTMWRYVWQVPGDLANARILSRAVDDSVNLERAGAGIAVRGRQTATP